MLRLTDAFVWEDLPVREPDTGSLAMVAWIPRIQKVISLVMYSAVITHVTQGILRILIVGDRSLLYGAWYPFDTTRTPAYELINIIQVKLPMAKLYPFFSTLYFPLFGTRRQFHHIHRVDQESNINILDITLWARLFV
jgi:hypothetical protein